MDLRGKVALVTGSNRGIGAAIVRILAMAGADVVVNYPTSMEQTEAKALVEELSAAGSMAIDIQADVTSPSEIEVMVKQTIGEFGSINILVNNAGIAKDGIFIRMSQEDWQRVLAVNLMGTVYCCQTVIPIMMKAKKGGAIVNVSSLMALTGNAGQANYCASKGAIISLTKSLAREYASRGIRVNAVAPGFIETDMTARIPERNRAKWIEQIPLGRSGTPAEVAKAVAFLASDESSYITGHVLTLDGGWMMV